eukprot:1153205-Pelagomonas_calceolata.AAC.1
MQCGLRAATFHQLHASTCWSQVPCNHLRSSFKIKKHAWMSSEDIVSNCSGDIQAAFPRHAAL